MAQLKQLEDAGELLGPGDKHILRVVSANISISHATPVEGDSLRVEFFAAVLWRVW